MTTHHDTPFTEVDAAVLPLLNTVAKQQEVLPQVYGAAMVGLGASLAKAFASPCFIWHSLNFAYASAIPSTTNCTLVSPRQVFTSKR